jgi:hypothetical protein
MAILMAQFLRARAWWRLDSAGASALPVARSVVALLDAAACLRDVPDDDPDLLALAAAGCFVGGVFDPGPEGADIIRSWQLADEPPAGPQGPQGPQGPRDLLAELVRAALQVAGITGSSPATAAISIPRQAGAAAQASAATQAPARTG